MRAEGDGAKAGGGGVDNVSTSWQYGRSLNTQNRKKELGRILVDNKVRVGVNEANGRVLLMPRRFFLALSPKRKAWRAILAI